MKFTYYGHACFSITVKDKHLLFDPYITENPLAKNIDIHQIKADYILVSHGHEDHVGDLLTIAKNTSATVIANFEIANWIIAQDYENVHPMNFGPYHFDFGKLHFVPAAHSSGLPGGGYGGTAGGFIIRSDEGNIYYSGDTCLSMEMQLIPKYASLDVAIMPVGGNFTMGIDDALSATEMIRCQKIVGVHFDTFGTIKIDHEAAKNTFRNAGKELILPEIGVTMEVS